MKIILITGKARSGKDVSAEIIEQILSIGHHSVLVTHYADLLKYILEKFFDWNGRKDEAGRSLLQYVGTDVIRKRDNTYFISFVEDMLTMFGDRWDYVIIPDVRFKNEHEKLVEDGFDTVVLRITRNNLRSDLTEEQKNHSSETELDEIKEDYSIENNGTLGDLVEELNKFIRNYVYGKLL